MVRIHPILASAIGSILLLISCSDQNDIQTDTIYENEPVEAIFGEQQISLTSEDYKALTIEALHVLRVQKPLLHEELQRKWFIRYYIQNHEYNESYSNEEIFQRAQERAEYENAWKDYAFEEYSISVNEDAVASQASYNLEVYQQNIPPSIIGMSEGLDLSIDEFMKGFDRDYVTRTVIWKELMPTLFEKHLAKSSERLDGVYLSQKYDQEVLEYLDQRES
ncbi:hypothetical protein [Salipaludibacillus sp. CF4.18]|uniref:hypothetical protein n=1 Tax=Salipaludibacillus sp. CF4.18 TaxID=3373081 RepID=UPI003EE4A7DB